MHQVTSLLRNCLILTLVWLLSWTVALANAEMPSEPAWPVVPQVSGDAGPPHFLLVRQGSGESSRYPIIVRDLRTWSTPDGTRLVLDLNHKGSFTETHLRNPDRVVIEVTNAILGKSSRQRVSGGTIPQSFQIAQSRPRVVSITLARTQGSKYKAFTLDNPDRLVIDLYHKSKDQIRQIGETSATSPSAPAVALPTPPAIPKPTVTEPVRPTAPKPASPIQTIVIDPGHGGKDPGTVGQHGTTEKDVTLKVGLLLKDLLATLPNTRVLMTRERDAFIELEDRAKFANGKDADLFVSIHLNASPNRTASGAEVYFLSIGAATDEAAKEAARLENEADPDYVVEEDAALGSLPFSVSLRQSDTLRRSSRLAEVVLSQLADRDLAEARGVRQAGFAVLKSYQIPSILVEIGFISSERDRVRLALPDYRQKLAEALADGVLQYLQEFAPKKSGP